MSLASILRFGETPRPALLRYGFACLVTSVALATSLLLEPLTAGRLPFLLFSLSIVVTAWYGGLGPGLLASVLSVFAVELVLLAPAGAPTSHPISHLVALSIFAGIALLVSWISSRTREAIDGLRQRSDELEARRGEAEVALGRLRLLERVSRTLTSSLDDERALAALARVSVESIADYCVTYVLEDGHLRRVAVAHAEPELEPLVGELLELSPPAVGTPGAGSVVASGEPVLATEIPGDTLRGSAQDPRHLAVLERLRPRSSMVLPLIARGRTVGAIAFATTDRSGRRYGDDDLSLARELASRAALAVDNARLYERSRREVEQRKVTEEALRRRELELRALVEHAPDMMVRLDRDLRYLYVNPAVESLLGRPRQEFIGHTLRESARYAGDELLAVWEETVGGVFASGQPATAEFSLPTPGGARFLHTRVVPEIGEDGEVETVLALARDITDRRMAEERQAMLVEAGRIATSTLDAAKIVDGLAELAAHRIAEWCVVYVLAPSGDAIERVVVAGSTPALQAAGEELVRLFPPALDRSDLPLARALLEGEETLMPRIDETMVERVAVSSEHRDMLRRLELRSAVLVPLPARGRILGAMGFFSADRARRYAADDLAVARELATQAALALDNARLYAELEQAVRLRDDILAIVAHDLRNPLYVISSLVGVVEARAGHAEAAFDLQGSIDSMRRAIVRADRLIQDLLDISRIEAGRLSVSPEEVDAAALIAEAAESARVRGVQKALRVECEVVDGCPAMLADRARAVQALGNLLDNAVEHSPDGARVTVRVAPLAGSGEIELTVRDEGPGVREEDLPHLFDRFWQADRRNRGTGLGLAIVKGIAEAHGGRATVASRPGQGSTFGIVLPAAEARIAGRRAVGGPRPGAAVPDSSAPRLRPSAE